jgi:hypothetical protein
MLRDVNVKHACLSIPEESSADTNCIERWRRRSWSYSESRRFPRPTPAGRFKLPPPPPRFNILSCLLFTFTRPLHAPQLTNTLEQELLNTSINTPCVLSKHPLHSKLTSKTATRRSTISLPSNTALSRTRPISVVLSADSMCRLKGAVLCQRITCFLPF